MQNFVFPILSPFFSRNESSVYKAFFNVNFTTFSKISHQSEENLYQLCRYEFTPESDEDNSDKKDTYPVDPEGGLKFSEPTGSHSGYLADPFSPSRLLLALIF